MSDFKTRLHDEKAELSTKIEKLSSFIDGDIFKTLDSHNQDLLKTQLHIMRSYENVLTIRISIIK